MQKRTKVIILFFLLSLVLIAIVKSVSEKKTIENNTSNTAPIEQNPDTVIHQNSKLKLTTEAEERLQKFGKLDAFTASHEFVKNKLISPSSAEFFYPYDNAVTKLNDTTWFVDSFVDSQNAYGAVIKKRYVCKLTYNPITDSEHCIDVELLPIP